MDKHILFRRFAFHRLLNFLDPYLSQRDITRLHFLRNANDLQRAIVKYYTLTTGIGLPLLG